MQTIILQLWLCFCICFPFFNFRTILLIFLTIFNKIWDKSKELSQPSILRFVLTKFRQKLKIKLGIFIWIAPLTSMLLLLRCELTFHLLLGVMKLQMMWKSYFCSAKSQKLFVLERILKSSKTKHPKISKIMIFSKKFMTLSIVPRSLFWQE